MSQKFTCNTLCRLIPVCIHLVPTEVSTGYTFVCLVVFGTKGFWFVCKLILVLLMARTRHITQPIHSFTSLSKATTVRCDDSKTHRKRTTETTSPFSTFQLTAACHSLNLSCLRINKQQHRPVAHPTSSAIFLKEIEIMSYSSQNRKDQLFFILNTAILVLLCGKISALSISPSLTAPTTVFTTSTITFHKRNSSPSCRASITMKQK